MSHLYLASFTWHDVYTMHVGTCISTLFYGQIPILFVQIYQFSLSAHQLSYFHLLPIMNNAAIIIHVQVFV